MTNASVPPTVFKAFSTTATTTTPITRGYQSFWNCSVEKKGYAGTAVFVRGQVDRWGEMMG